MSNLIDNFKRNKVGHVLEMVVDSGVASCDQHVTYYNSMKGTPNTLFAATTTYII